MAFDSQWVKKLDEMVHHGLYINKIREHLRLVLQMVESTTQENCDFIEKLNQPTFWHMLTKLNPENLAAEEIHAFWKQHSSYTTVSSQSLIAMRYAHLHPLEYFIRLQINEWENLLELKKNFYLIKQDKTAIKQIEKSLAELLTFAYELNNFNQLIQKTLINRCLLYEHDADSRYVDDVLYVIKKKLNKLEALPFPIKADTEYKVLDDDTRIMVYDWISQACICSDEMCQRIKQPINQKAFRPPLKAQSVEKEYKNVNAFAEKIESYLRVQSKLKIEDIKVEQEASKDSFLWRWVCAPVINFIVPSFITAFLTWVNEWRAVLLPMLALLGYILVAPSIAAFFSLHMGTMMSTLISNVLLYGVALLPTWYFGFYAIKNATHLIMSKLMQDKNYKITLALDEIRSSSSFAKDFLSAGVVDVPHFNVGLLETTTKQKILALQKAKEDIQKHKWYEVLFMRGKYAENHLKVIQSIDNQIELLQSRLAVYAQFLTEKMPEEMQTLETDLKKKNWTPRILPGHFQRIRAFVQTYGTAEQVNAFDKISCVHEQFADSIINMKLLYKSPRVKQEYPWGGYEVHSALIRGWTILIEHLTHKESQKNAALKIAQIIDGTFLPTPLELHSLIQDLEVNQPSVYDFLSMHLFLTLDKRDVEFAKFLSAQHRKTIKEWYQSNLSEIRDAHAFMISLFVSKANKNNQVDDITDEQLEKYFYLLDGASIAQHCLKNPPLKPFTNVARGYFEKYQGEHDKITYFIRFLPQAEQDSIVPALVQKRIEYLIAHANMRRAISDADIELFKNPNFIKSKKTATELLRTNPAFVKSYSKGFDHLLQQLVDSGIVLKKILNEYTQMHKCTTSKPAMQSLPYQSCYLQARNAHHPININNSSLESSLKCKA